MDCKVETTEDSILQYVTNPEEGIIEFSGRVEEQHFVKLASNSDNIGTIKKLEAEEFGAPGTTKMSSHALKGIFVLSWVKFSCQSIKIQILILIVAG